MNKLKLMCLMLCAIPGIGLAQNYILWNGGVGADERELAPSEGTRLVFFVESGSFLAGVEVTVKDMQGNELVNTLSNGPWLILDLPEGKYQVNAQINENNAQGGLINVDNSNQEFAYKFSEEN